MTNTHERYHYAFHSNYHRGMNCTSILNKSFAVAACDCYVVDLMEPWVVVRVAMVEDQIHHLEALEYQV